MSLIMIANCLIFCPSSLHPLTWPSCQAHRETFKNLLDKLYNLFSSRIVQDSESDDLRKNLDHCIKLLHKCSELLLYMCVCVYVCVHTCTCVVGRDTYMYMKNHLYMYKH